MISYIIFLTILFLDVSLFLSIQGLILMFTLKDKNVMDLPTFVSISPVIKPLRFCIILVVLFPCSLQEDFHLKSFRPVLVILLIVLDVPESKTDPGHDTFIEDSVIVVECNCT